MTGRNTTQEWLAAMEQAEKSIPSTFPQYKAPGLGSEEFSQSIDHTLLKLEATHLQIDELCEEAKKHNFKVDLTIASFFMFQEWLRLRRRSHIPLTHPSRFRQRCV